MEPIAWQRRFVLVESHFPMRTPHVLIFPLMLLAFGCVSPVAEEAGMAGQSAPDITVKRLKTEEKVKLSNLKGKVVLLDFWATWCGPCRQSSPEVQEMYDKYKDKGFEVMAISSEEPGEVERFEEQSGRTYPVYLERLGEASAPYRVQGLPTFILVGRDGKILKDERGYAPGLVTSMVETAMQ
jgi:thiol-disulfide isomerase/thioredoxin